MIFMLPNKIEIKIQLFKILVLELDVLSCWNTQSGPGGNSAGSLWVVGDWETWECFSVQYITNVVSKSLFSTTVLVLGTFPWSWSWSCLYRSLAVCVRACVNLQRCADVVMCRLRRRLFRFQVFAKSMRVSSFQLCVAAKMCRAGTRVTQQLNTIG